jgi:hypothetical protein
MLQTLTRRALVAGVTLSFLAGCSGISGNSWSSLTPGSATRILPGPAVAGPTIVPTIPRKPNARAGWPDQRTREHSLLFVADESSGVLIYDPRVVNSSPIGSITTGVNTPAGLAVDRSETLYVANQGNNTVTVYPDGQSSPTLTISSGLSGPYGIAVDSMGNVFVSNLNTNTITAYAAGSTSPYETINFYTYGQAVGMAVDASDNLWVACDTSNAVFEILAGTTTVQNAGLSNLNGPIGVSFGRKDQMFVSNFAGSDVNIYTYGTTSPSGTITTGIEKYGPTLNGFSRPDKFFQTNQSDDVVGYTMHQTTPHTTLSGSGVPLGIASAPEVHQ